MKHHNEDVLRKMNIELFHKFGINGLIKKIDQLELRVAELEAKKRPGRPRRAAND